MHVMPRNPFFHIQLFIFHHALTKCIRRARQRVFEHLILSLKLFALERYFFRVGGQTSACMQIAFMGREKHAHETLRRVDTGPRYKLTNRTVAKSKVYTWSCSGITKLVRSAALESPMRPREGEGASRAMHE